MSNLNALLKIHRIFDRFLLRKQQPNFDQYMTSYKFPRNPKIVVLGGQFPLIQNLIQKHFEKFHHFSITDYLKGVSPTESSNERQLINSVGQYLLKGEGKGAFGHILTDFPKNVDQAKGLDEMLDGVNLAIRFEIYPGLEKDLQGKYLECKSCGKVFNLGLNFSSPEQPGSSSLCEDPILCHLAKLDKDLPIEDQEYSDKLKDLEKYYDERGLLLRFRICPKKAQLSFDEINDKLYQSIESSIKL